MQTNAVIPVIQDSMPVRIQHDVAGAEITGASAGVDGQL